MSDTSEPDINVDEWRAAQIEAGRKPKRGRKVEQLRDMVNSKADKIEAKSKTRETKKGSLEHHIAPKLSSPRATHS